MISWFEWFERARLHYLLTEALGGAQKVDCKTQHA